MTQKAPMREAFEFAQTHDNTTVAILTAADWQSRAVVETMRAMAAQPNLEFPAAKYIFAQAAVRFPNGSQVRLAEQKFVDRWRGLHADYVLDLVPGGAWATASILIADSEHACYKKFPS